MSTKNKIISIRLEAEVYEQLKVLCEAQDLPVSLVVRQVLKEWLQRQAELKKEAK